MAHISAETSSLQELVQQKENEWREAQELQNKSLQSALKEKERQLNNERVRFRKLKEDFEYNLKLLEERDGELQRYDALFSQVRNINSLRDGEVSDLKIQLDDLRLKLSHEEKAKEELQRHYQQVLNLKVLFVSYCVVVKCQHLLALFRVFFLIFCVTSLADRTIHNTKKLPKFLA